MPIDAVPGSDASLLVFAAIGVLGGAHCLGMCGPLVTLYSDQFQEGENAIRQHALFNAGRTASYAVIGGVAGALGAAAFDTAAVASVGDGVRAAVGVAVGIVIVAVGGRYLVTGTTGTSGVPVVGRGAAVAGRGFATVSGHIAARVETWARGPRIAALGALHGVLPCPILYPAYLYALAQGSPLKGALSLGVLGLGTVPTLFAYGTAVGTMSPSARVRLHRVMGALFVVLGYLPLAHGLTLAGVPLPTPPIPMYQPL